MSPRVNGRPAPLDQRLVLVDWLVGLFGYSSNQEMLQHLGGSDEGLDPEGRSYLYHALVGRGAKVKIPPDQLATYDANIFRHLRSINGHRAEPITLRYFQYLSLLFTEIILDRAARSQSTLIQDLNAYVDSRNAARRVGDSPLPYFAASDLTRLAYWMATGSGKTLLLHINYHQFKHYVREAFDNVLLVTPNEDLSRYHLEELSLSGIPCERFIFDSSGLALTAPDTVRVIEITKLVEDKRGGGVSVPVEYFDGKNLVFVDEGHKGSGGETWRRYRDALARTGFTFEYSATFGQAVAAARSEQLTAIYGKSIVFDYSYRYFYGDGYGKDFRILNIQRHVTDSTQRLLLLGNLLSFFEQKLRFGDGRDELHSYNIADPLWVFVGSSVNAVYRQGGHDRSDVLTVVRFFQAFLQNRQQWAVKGLGRLLGAETGLQDATGRDVFADRFEYLRHIYDGRLDELYDDILKGVFHATGRGSLLVKDLRGQEGELALQATSSRHDFGVIYVGDTAKLKRLVADDESGVTVEDDVISDSLFADINLPVSRVNVLIGARKFTEGWSSWRVSSMALLNIGQSEGSEIIQLFGRGVRLLGLDRSLKRSGAIDGEHPVGIGLLETLNIFSVRANYMQNFRTYLEREGVDPDGRLELTLKVRPSDALRRKRLLIPRLSGVQKFRREHELMLQPDAAAAVVLDLSTRAQSLASGSSGMRSTAVRGGTEQVFRHDVLATFDWNAVADELLSFKHEKSYDNLVIGKNALREILASSDPRLCRVVADPRSLASGDVRASMQAQAMAIAVLKKYVAKYFRVSQERWESANMVYAELTDHDTNFRDYNVKLPRSDAALISQVERLIMQADRVYSSEVQELPNVYFDRHLYQPLLVDRAGNAIKSDPPGLGESELRFVHDLRAYLQTEQGRQQSDEVFLLRNLTRGKGVGFFENEGFYPDFIMWIRDSSGDQRIVFLEPHGMLHEAAYWTSAKAQLHVRLARLTEQWQPRSPGPKVELDAFLISRTPYDTLRPLYGTGDWSREEFARRHILFFDSDNYISALFTRTAATHAEGRD